MSAGIVRSVLVAAAVVGAAFVGAAPAGAATVVQECRVVEGQTLCIVPDLRGETRAEAAEHLKLSGFFLGRSLATVDPTCNFLGTVVRQDPRAGSVAPRGTTVTVYIGVRPTGTECP